MLFNYNNNGHCSNFTECHMYFVRLNEWKEIEFSWKKLIIVLLPVNNFYKEWTQLTRQLHALIFIANIYVCYEMFSYICVTGKLFFSWN